MSSIADGSVRIQTSAEAQPATPSWLGEVALVASHLQKQGILTKICERVRFARRRFGRYDVIDFLAVLFGYAITYEVLLSYRTGSMIGGEGTVRISYPDKSSWRTLYAI